MEQAPPLAEALAELNSAEDFLDYFGVPYEARVLQVNRLHILQRFHDYLAKQAPNLPPEPEAQHAIYRLWLERAYLDFVHSSPLAERVFRVLREAPQPGGGASAFVPLAKLLPAGGAAS